MHRLVVRLSDALLFCRSYTTCRIIARARPQRPLTHTWEDVGWCTPSMRTTSIKFSFLPRDALCALRGIATLSRPYVRPSACP